VSNGGASILLFYINGDIVGERINSIGVMLFMLIPMTVVSGIFLIFMFKKNKNSQN